MKCPFKIEKDCYKKYLMILGFFVLAVIVLSLVIKLAAWILSWFSSDLYLNTIIVMFSSIVVLIAAYKCCCKHKKCTYCGKELNQCVKESENNEF